MWLRGRTSKQQLGAAASGMTYGLDTREDQCCLQSSLIGNPPWQVPPNWLVIYRNTMGEARRTVGGSSISSPNSDQLVPSK
jgi:hypothetical protein